MKANELRIGNYLQDKENRLCKVKGLILEEHDEIYAPVINWPVTVLPISPIPLTEQWLIDFGFKRKKSRMTWILEMPNSEATLQILTGNEGISICRIGISAYNSNCEYVHKLQNIYFALTGEELTLNK